LVCQSVSEGSQKLWWCAANQGDRHDQPYVADISEDFFAGTLSSGGSPKAPAVHVAAEGRFYAYNPETGLYMEQTEHALAARLSPTLLLCAQEAGKEVNVGNLIYRFRKTASLRGVLQRSKGLLAVPHSFFDSGLTESIRLTDLKLLPSARRHDGETSWPSPTYPGLHAPGSSTC